MPFLVPIDQTNTNQMKIRARKHNNRGFLKGLIPLVLLYPVQVVSANNDSSHHFGTVAGTSNDTTSNRYITSEWAFLVNVSSWPRGILSSTESTHPQYKK